MSRRQSLAGIENLNTFIINETNEQNEIYSWNTILNELNKNENYKSQVHDIYNSYYINHHYNYIIYDFLNFDENQYDPMDIELIMISYNNKKVNYKNFNNKNEDNYIYDLKSKFYNYTSNTNNIDKIPIVIEISKKKNPDFKFYLFFRIKIDQNDKRQKRRENYYGNFKNNKFIIDELYENIMVDSKNKSIIMDMEKIKDQYVSIKILDEENSVFDTIVETKNKSNIAQFLVDNIRRSNYFIHLDTYGHYFTDPYVNPNLYFRYEDTGFYINMLSSYYEHKLKYSHISFHTQDGSTNKIHFKFENEKDIYVKYETVISIESYENNTENYFKFVPVKNKKLHENTDNFLDQIMTLTQKTISKLIFNKLSDELYYKLITKLIFFNQLQIHEYLRTKFTTEKQENSLFSPFFHHYEFKIKDKKLTNYQHYFEFTIINVNKYEYEFLAIEIEIYTLSNDNIGKISAIPYIDENENLVKLFYMIDSDFKKYSNLLNVDFDSFFFPLLPVSLSYSNLNVDFDSFFLSYLIDQNEFKRHIEIRNFFLNNFYYDNLDDLRVDIYSDTYVVLIPDNDGRFFIEYVKIKEEDKPILRLDINLENFIELDNYIRNENFQNIFNNEKNKKIFKIEYIYNFEYFKIWGEKKKDIEKDKNTYVNKLNDDNNFYEDNFNDMYQITNKLLSRLYNIDENYMYKYSLNKKIYDDILGRYLLYIGNYKSNKDEGIDFDKNHILRPGKIYNTFNKNYNFIIIKKKSGNLTSYFFLYRKERKQIILLGISHYDEDGSKYGYTYRPKVIELSNNFNEYYSFPNYTDFIKDNLNYYMQIENTEYILHNKKMNLLIKDNLNYYMQIETTETIKLAFEKKKKKNYGEWLLSYGKDDFIDESFSFYFDNLIDNSIKKYYLMDELFYFYFSFNFDNGTIELSYVNFPLAKLYFRFKDFRFKDQNKIVYKLEFETNYKILQIYEKFTKIIQKKKILINENALIIIKKYEHEHNAEKSNFETIDNILDIFNDKNIKIHVAEKNKQENDFEQIYFFTNINQDTEDDNKYNTIFNLFEDEFSKEFLKRENISFNFMIKDINKTLDDSDQQLGGTSFTHQNLFKIDRFKGINDLRIIFFDNNNFEDCNFKDLLDKNHLKNIKFNYFYTFKNYDNSEKSNVLFFDTFPLIKFNYKKKLTIIICREKIYIWKKICTQEVCQQIIEGEALTLRDTNFSDYQFNYIFDESNDIQIKDIKFKYGNQYIIEKNINQNQYNISNLYNILISKIRDLIIILMEELLGPHKTYIDDDDDDNNIFITVLKQYLENLNMNNLQNGGYFNKYIKYKKKYLNINFPNYDFKKECIKNGIDYKTKYLKYKKKYLNNEK
jgi:hypothetical protein